MSHAEIKKGDAVRVLPLRLWPEEIKYDPLYECNNHRDLAGMVFSCKKVRGGFCEICPDIYFPKVLLQKLSSTRKGRKSNQDNPDRKEMPPMTTKERIIAEINKRMAGSLGLEKATFEECLKIADRIPDRELAMGRKIADLYDEIRELEETNEE